MQSQKNGKPTSRLRKLKLWLLSVIFALLVSACASSSQMQQCVPSRATVDPSLMAEPNYTQTLLNFLSVKPSEPMPK